MSRNISKDRGEFASYPSLRDRVVFVSGGASGLGEEFVRQLAGQGARVAFVDIDEDRGAALQRELGEDTLFRPCDVRDIPALRAALAARPTASARSGCW